MSSSSNDAVSKFPTENERLEFSHWLFKLEIFLASKELLDVVPWCPKSSSRMITPFMETRDGQPWLVIPADAGYPVDGEKFESAARG